MDTSESGVKELLNRIRTLEDIEAIKKVTAQYCRASDKDGSEKENYVEGIHACFTEDGVWDGGEVGYAKGIEGFRNLWGSDFFAQTLPFVNHLALNPVIEVKGDEATGDWHLVAQQIFNGEATWTAGRYHNQYARTPKGWRIKHMKYVPWMWTRHLRGWALERFIDTGIALVD
jgi:hypothetical protein